MKCIVCGSEFEAQRSTAQYCSAKCKMRAKRGVSVTDDPVTVTDVTLSPVTLTDDVTLTGHVLTGEDLEDWGGTMPTWLHKPTGCEHLTDHDLQGRLNMIQAWQDSPEYAERVYRLTHWMTDYVMPSRMTQDVA